jgi:hypothetical protein
VEPVVIDGWCGYRGTSAPTCPGYQPGPAWRPPEHLIYLPLARVPGEGLGCAHLVPVGTVRGGFRGACGHPGGNPRKRAVLLGRVVRPVRVEPVPEQ